MITVFIAACLKENGSEIGEGSIDREYLQTDAYQAFKERAQLERERTVRQRKNLINFIRKRVTADGGPKLNLPVIINEQIIQDSYQTASAGRSSLTTIFGFKQIYHPLGKVTINDLDYYFFMTCKVKSYKDCLVWVASMEGNEVFQIEMITTYLQTLTYSEIPTIKIATSGIDIVVNRNVEYPFSTNERYRLRYNFDEKGKIVHYPRN